MLMARGDHKSTPSLVRRPRCDADSFVTMSHASTSGGRPLLRTLAVTESEDPGARQPDIWYITPTRRGRHMARSRWRAGADHPAMASSTGVRMMPTVLTGGNARTGSSALTIFSCGRHYGQLVKFLL